MHLEQNLEIVHPSLWHPYDPNLYTLQNEIVENGKVVDCISDILNLQWEDFAIAPDQGYCLRIRTQKTQTEATLPISYEAYELCGTPGTGKVFKGLKRSMINYPLKNWLKKAGITKPITFHGFRHSYAVIQISLGTDIYTVSKMLTHKNVSTTQIYADLVNVKKRETANKISLK